MAIAGSVGNLPRVKNMDIQYAQSAVLTPCDFAFPSTGVKSEATPNTEMILVTMPAAVTSSTGLAAKPQVYQFTAAAGGSGTGNFLPGSDFTTGNTPTGIAAGDVDGDLDLAATNGATTVAVRINQNTAPLPVELTAFSATAKAPNVQLSWRTASEKNSARFEVERSQNGLQFDKIGEVAQLALPAGLAAGVYVVRSGPSTLRLLVE